MKGKTEPPKAAAGELWVDPDFTMEMAMEGLDADVEWKRPGVSCDYCSQRSMSVQYKVSSESKPFS